MHTSILPPIHRFRQAVLSSGLLLAMVLSASAQLLHYRVSDTDDISTSVPNIGSLGDGTNSGTGAVTLSADVPTLGIPAGAGNRSMSFPGNAGVLAPGSQQLLNSQIRLHGGFTYEAWVKYTGNGNINSIIDYAGTEKLRRLASSSGYSMLTNASPVTPFVTAPTNEWHYIAVVFHNIQPETTAGEITGDYTFYVDGIVPLSTVQNVTITDFGDGLNRSIGVGTHPQLLASDFFNGLIYEPRVTLAAVTPENLLFAHQIVTNTNDAGAGSLRAAIAAASSGSLITFDPTLDGQTITLSSGQLLIDKNITIDASTLTSGLTIDANGGVTNHRVIEIETGSSVELSHLTITGGRTPDAPIGEPGESGGGIYCGGNLTLTHCNVSNNSTGRGGDDFGAAPAAHGGDGGGIYIYVGSLTLNDSTVTGNTTGDGGDGQDGGIGGSGGGIYVSSSGAININNSTVDNNATGDGGGGNNSYGGGGGGICLFSAASNNLNNSTVANNSTGDGSYSGSNSGGPGGGIHIFSSDLTLHNSVIAGNTTGLSPTGTPGTGPDLLRSSIEFESTGANFIGDHSGIEHSASLSGILSGNAMLAPLGDYGGPTQTMPPLPGSPLLDLLTDNSTSTDQRGFPRPTSTNASWQNDFSSGLNGATVFTSGNDAATGTIDNGSFRFTDAVASQGAALVLPSTGIFTEFTASFDLFYQLHLSDAADGFSFSFGPAATTATFSSGSLENGVPGAYVISFDTYDGTAGPNSTGNITLRGPNGATISTPYTFFRANEAGAFRSLTVTLDGTGHLVVTYKGNTIIDQMINYTPTAGDSFTFAARTGDLAAEHRIDNIVINYQSQVEADIGAVEIQDATDSYNILSDLWLTDEDGDGQAFGVEFALGTNPKVANTVNFTGPTINSSGQATLNFGLNLAAVDYTIWKLTRSTTLEVGSFEEVLRYDGAFDQLTLGENITVAGSGEFIVTDEAPPTGKAFYRFEAELIAPP
ncbi:hypothetical protein JO972_15025 [Verrucomicrobiaceae bacterium 5K15]|uniref:Uncharacterized protein n=1 Tax=Oceaniferula flava TaxID=2800421 RepID=A0AAE2SH65_9BACT|nr:choice-of-anchor Q domain-containing protein [Oceaniferula flavus]MBK1856281.1 hypothetical protein [Oceaniferula flavus]MBM1137588.1 hypothetical protein [Oceaniferula flavus]